MRRRWMMKLMKMRMKTNGCVRFSQLSPSQDWGGIYAKSWDSQDICGDIHSRYLCTNTFFGKLICAQICAQMGLGDFCTVGEDGGEVYAKSLDKRNPPAPKGWKVASRNSKNTESQNTKYYCLANTCSEKLMMIVNDNDRLVPREDILAPRGQLTLVTPFTWRLFGL